MRISRLKISDYLPRDKWLHVARAHYTQSAGSTLHGHADFAEVFWIERGRGFHIVNGLRVPLAPGDVVLLRRKDVHGFSVAAGEQLDFVNVAFRDGVLADLQRRFFARKAWPWRGNALPTMVRLSPPVRERLSRWADSFTPAAQSKLELEGFLIDLLRILADQRDRFHGAALPTWLDAGLAHITQHCNLNVPALAAATGKSREHINRVVRSSTGRTTTALLNDIRIEEAARRLRMTPASILDIAMEVGLPNLGHFYTLFAQRMGTTPRRYRIRERALLP